MIDSVSLTILMIACVLFVFAILFFIASLRVEPVAQFFDSINKEKHGELDREIFRYFLQLTAFVILFGGSSFPLAIYLLSIDLRLLGALVFIIFMVLPPLVSGVLVGKKIMRRN